jgi:hypothetical protein
MKTFVFIASLISLATAAPTNVDSSTPGKVLGGVLAHIAALPLLGPLWLNAAISGNRVTNELSTPKKFTPVAVASGKDQWGSKENNIPVYISYARLAGNRTTTRSVVGVWHDRNNLWDGKVAAVNLDLGSTIQAVPANVTEFTRTFTCSTGDRVNPTERAYLFIKAYDSEGNKNDIMSDRFTMVDNRWAAGMTGALYTVKCRFVSDEYNKLLPVREETSAHSDDLPVDASNKYN